MKQFKKRYEDKNMEFENILTLIKTVSDSELTNFKYEENGVKLSLSKRQNQVVSSVTYEPSVINETAKAVPVPQKTESIVEKQDALEDLSGNIIKSPLVGTFYTAPSEDADAYVKVGDKVKKGQTLAIIEAMKLMNEIESEFDGNISEVYVENGQAVEYGQPLFKVS